MVERNLAKVEVAGSSPVIRLKCKDRLQMKAVFVFHTDREDEKTPASSRRELAAYEVSRGSSPVIRLKCKSHFRKKVVFVLSNNECINSEK